MSTDPTPTTPADRPSVAGHADQAVQRIADASIWLLFRLHGVRS